MKPSLKPYCTLWVNELRLKQALSSSFPDFYNPVALIILVCIAKNTTSKEFIVIPNKSHSISKYITFIKKNNERVLKKISIDYIFKELPQNGLDSFFFLVEMNNELRSFKALQELEGWLNTNLVLNDMPAQLVAKSIAFFFEDLLLSNLFLHQETLSTLKNELNIHIANDFLSLSANFEIHL